MARMTSDQRALKTSEPVSMSQYRRSEKEVPSMYMRYLAGGKLNTISETGRAVQPPSGPKRYSCEPVKVNSQHLQK